MIVHNYTQYLGYRRFRNDPRNMLPIVKKHVDDAYLTVGVTEDMESFMEVIENLMPHYFYNATYVFKQTGKYEVVKLEQGHICFTTGDNLMSKINVRY